MNDQQPTSPGEWPVLHFAQSNPKGAGQDDACALLRRVADTIESLGDVDIADICFQSVVVDGEDEVSMTVYFNRC